MSTTLQAGSSIIESTIELTNLSKEPRPLMYLAHLNFRPAVGGRIEESLRSGETTITRASYNAGRAGAITERRPNDAVNIDEMLAEGFRVEPELVQTVPVVADTEGWSRVAQVHSDGSVDVVSHRSADLTHTIRWLRRSADDDAFGFALPATGEADGFAAEQAKGNVRNYAPGASLSAGIRHGMLPARITHRP